MTLPTWIATNVFPGVVAIGAGTGVGSCISCVRKQKPSPHLDALAVTVGVVAAQAIWLGIEYATGEGPGIVTDGLSGMIEFYGDVAANMLFSGAGAAAGIGARLLAEYCSSQQEEPLLPR